MRHRIRRTRYQLLLGLDLTLVAGASILIYFSVFAANEIQPTPDVRHALGQILFLSIMLIHLLAFNFSMPVFAAGAIAGERQDRTLELLGTSPLSARQIIWGKLGSTMMFALLLLVTSLPFLGAVFLLGGVGLLELGISTALLILAAAAWVAIGIWLSSVLPRLLPATVLAYAVSNGLLFGAPGLFLILAALSPQSLDAFMSTLVAPSFTGSNVFLQVVLSMGTWLLAATSPITSAVLSRLLLLEHDALLWHTLALPGQGSLAVPSPWLISVVLYGLAVWFFSRQAARRLDRGDKL